MAGGEKTGYWLFKQEAVCSSYAAVEESNPEQHGLKLVVPMMPARWQRVQALSGTGRAE